MTYNLSTKAVVRWSDTLEHLLSGEEVLFRSADPHKLAYRLREALAAAAYHQIEPYCKIAYGFTVKDDFVLAKPKASFFQKPVRVTRRIEGSVDDYNVVKVASLAKEHILEFPAFEGELRSVKVWCAANDFLITTDPYLILTKKEAEDD